MSKISGNETSQIISNQGADLVQLVQQRSQIQSLSESFSPVKSGILVQHSAEIINVGIQESCLVPFSCVLDNYVYFILPRIAHSSIKGTLTEDCSHIRFTVTRTPPSISDLAPYFLHSHTKFTTLTSSFEIKLPFKVSPRNAEPLKLANTEWLGLRVLLKEDSDGHFLGDL